MSDQNNTQMENVTLQVGWINRINLLYGAFGLMFFSQAGGFSSWKSFALGWVLAVLNLELLKRLGASLCAVYDGSKIGPMFYFMLFGKFAFWGLVIAALTQAKWVQPIPFVMGMATILISGFGLGIKELIYAR